MVSAFMRYKAIWLITFIVDIQLWLSVLDTFLFLNVVVDYFYSLLVTMYNKKLQN